MVEGTLSLNSYIELLNSNSNNKDLLLVHSIAVKERNTFLIQLNLISNVRKRLLISQSILFLKDLILFKTLSASII